MREEVGAVVLATGFDLYAKGNMLEYGAGRYLDVVDSLQFEQMLKEGNIHCPSDGRIPQEVVWVQCAGSRAPDRHRPYCSKICCMYVAKQAIAYRCAVPEGQAYIFYIDIRSQVGGTTSTCRIRWRAMAPCICAERYPRLSSATVDSRCGVRTR